MSQSVVGPFAAQQPGGGFGFHNAAAYPYQAAPSPSFYAGGGSGTAPNLQAFSPAVPQAAGNSSQHGGSGAMASTAGANMMQFAGEHCPRFSAA
jgi:hypothetical protein